MADGDIPGIPISARLTCAACDGERLAPGTINDHENFHLCQWCNGRGYVTGFIYEHDVERIHAQVPIDDGCARIDLPSLRDMLIAAFGDEAMSLGDADRIWAATGSAD